MKTILLFIPLFSFFGYSYGQYNTVRESDILYKERIIRSINLRNSLNEDLFGKENLLVQVLLEAYENGELIGYKNDECKEVLSKEDFKSKREVPLETGDTHVYAPRHLYKVEIGEDLIFDRNRSEIIFDMESITIFIPEELNYKHLLEPIISFKYDDCVKIFKKDSRAVAINPLKNGRNINYSEVFLLKLYRSDIVKIGNDLYFDQMYSDVTMAYIARKDAENKLTEYLYKLYNPQ